MRNILGEHLLKVDYIYQKQLHFYLLIGCTLHVQNRLLILRYWNGLHLHDCLHHMQWYDRLLRVCYFQQHRYMSLQHDRKLKNSPAGVVTGLAWTQIGGEILFIETRAMHGSGQVILTGQLGDVMKESATISVSLVKSIFMNDKLDFKNTDIHIHVPSGAVPKDGPSAGITLLTALVSLVTGIPVSNELAMTGEVSLRGQVMPIGGLPEKLMAAQRSGIKKVLIPKANVRDLEDVPEEVRNSLEIVPVETIDEVIRHALGIKLPPYNNRPFNVSFGKDGQNIA